MAGNQPSNNSVQSETAGPEAAAQNPAAPPVIALPKGGGAVRGIGEKFAANPVTGTGSLSVPLAVSPGRAGFGPQLSLSYDSGAGNGPFGFGWNLSLPAITRKTDKGLPQYHDDANSDVFVLSGAEDLVPVFKKDQLGNWQHTPAGELKFDETTRDDYLVRHYRPRIEGLFARIERWTRLSDGDTHWRSISKDNITTLYGLDEQSRLFDPADPARVFSWLICESFDDKGNLIRYSYKAEDGAGLDSAAGPFAQRYLKRIRYGNLPSRLIQPEPDAWLFELVFDYGEHAVAAPLPNDPGDWLPRPDPFSTCRPGFELRTQRLCRRVLMFHHFPAAGPAGPDEPAIGANCLVRATEFAYELSPIATYLTAVTHASFRRAGNGYSRRALPLLQFEYSRAEIQAELKTIDPTSVENLPAGLDGGRYQWADLWGEGLSGVLTEQAEGWFYKRNLSPLTWQVVRNDTGQDTVEAEARFGPLALVASRPSPGNLAGRQQLLDLGGDGQPDVVQFAPPLAGYFSQDEAGRWQPFVAFQNQPNIDWQDPNLRHVELTGDGHADLLLARDGYFVWHRSLAKEGFGPAQLSPQPPDDERGPRLVFADGRQSIFLADMNGDGLADLVRVDNGEICYWPSLGYGRFGPKVSMANAPCFDRPEQFDPQRLRLADIDGSGVTDILYLGQQAVWVYLNQSGNSWSQPHQLDAFPRPDNLASVQALDLLGTGTACLVWSSPLGHNARQPVRYLDLMGGQKPHLLVRVVNNLGAETRVQYAPSTKFYLQDEHDGRPWLTKLPFPVHVVERVETFDRISRTWFVSRYAYHHGYFDGVEREFRGFGMVEQWDTAEFNSLKTDSEARLGDSANINAASHVPPVWTKTWFHTGAYVDGEHISNFFAGIGPGEGEYYREPALRDEAHDAAAQALLLDDTVLPPGLSPAEEREACRALKGSVLRQEIYALDDSPQAEHPYRVTERNYSIESLQPQGSNPHAVFFVHARETIDYYYERNPADPRVSYALVLAVDDFGNVLQAAAIGYGRWTASTDPALTPADHDRQRLSLLTCTETQVTAVIDTADAYRVPVPCDSRTFELPARLLAPRVRLTLPQLAAEIGAATAIPYEKTVQSGQKRLIEHGRTLFYRDDLAGPLPLGQQGQLGLLFESYKLAFTPNLLAGVYTRAAENLLPNPAILGAEGGYVPGDACRAAGWFPAGDSPGLWWLPSGQSFFAPPAAEPARPAPLPQNLATARAHFFTPHGQRDAFGRLTYLTHDAYDLLLTATRDPLGNAVQADNNYRLLQPWQLTDPNGHPTAVAFDTLGLVVGTAQRSRTGAGDSLAGFKTDLTQTELDAFFAAPHGQAAGLLQQATTRIVYDINRYANTGSPAYAAALARETHISDPGGTTSKIQVSFAYADGFGREIQKKLPAEPGPVADGGPPVKPRWVGSGWTIFNNKGKPVRQFEPFFTGTHAFQFDRQAGVSATLFYDPAERVVATLHPNHTYEKTVFTPWQQQSFDVNDTVTFKPQLDPNVADFFARLPPADYLPTWHTLRTDPALALAHWPTTDPANAAIRAAELAAAIQSELHANTPTTAHFDALGRVFLTLADNGLAGQYASRVALDIEGNPREISDAQNRVVMRYQYDMLGHRIQQASMESGERWLLNDAAGQSFRAWNSRGYNFRTEYDALRRPVRTFVRGTDPLNPAAEILFQASFYGEQAGTAALNARGRLLLHADGAGVTLNAGVNPDTGQPESYDFKGNLLRSTRRLARDYKQPVDWVGPHWAAVAAALTATPFQPDAVLAPLAALLESDSYATAATFDALNRPITLTSPDGSVTQPRFNEANLLDSVSVRLRGANQPETPFVTNINTNAKGQREQVEYDNGAITRYRYDPDTFRLVQLITTRPGGQNGLASQIFTDASRLQDLHYTYDPAGNLTQIADNSLRELFFGGEQIRPVARYSYDAIYRLVSAEGREHSDQAALEFNPVSGNRRDYPLLGGQAGGNNPQALRNYREQYSYDNAGNLTELAHIAAGGSWTRAFVYQEASLLEPNRFSNRLTRTTLGPHTEVYGYIDAAGADVHGAMTGLNGLAFAWDMHDQLRQVDLGGGGTAYYVYDAAGQRVRKVIERQNGTRREERLYLGDFELYREFAGDGASVTLARETLHVLDGKQRLALVETKTMDAAAPPFSPAPRLRYQLGNHLGSVTLELDEQAGLISYEEYTPFGCTAFQAAAGQVEVSRKRYRYTGKERDEETGLYYHGARYYAPWLGRWTSCDPAGLVDGANLYLYVNNNPLNFFDPRGRQGHPDDYLDAGAPLPPPPPDYVNESGESIYLMSDEQRQQQKAELQEGGTAPPALASKGIVATTGGTEVKKYIRQEVVTGQKAALRSNPVVMGILSWGFLLTLPFSQERAVNILNSVSGPEPNSEVAKGAEMYTTLALSIGEMLLLAGAGAALKKFQLRMPTLGKPSAPSTPYNFTIKNGRPTLTLGEGAPTFGYKANPTPATTNPLDLRMGPRGKVTASTPGGPLVMSGVDDAAVGVYQYRLATGQPQLPHFRDTFGTPGTYYATHAEAKAWFLNPNASSISVSKIPCVGCIEGFRAESMLIGQPIQIHAPTDMGAATWNFLPNGSVTVTPFRGEF